MVFQAIHTIVTNKGNLRMTDLDCRKGHGENTAILQGFVQSGGSARFGSEQDTDLWVRLAGAF